MIVRAARPMDVAAVSALEAELFGRDAWSPAVVASELSHRMRRSVVAEVGENVVGYAILLAMSDTADLQRIGVGLHHQRAGVAKSMIAALVLDRYSRVSLEVRADNEAAIRLYEVAGFDRFALRRRYYADGCDAVLMQRDAAASPPDA